MEVGIPEQDETDAVDLEPGRFIDNKTRKVQQVGGAENSLGTNLSNLGTSILGVEKSDEIDLVIFDNGVWIPRR